jgi:hypothetical protein
MRSESERDVLVYQQKLPQRELAMRLSNITALLVLSGATARLRLGFEIHRYQPQPLSYAET